MNHKKPAVMAIGAAFFAFVLALSGCSSSPQNERTSDKSSKATTQGHIEITDVEGRSVSFDSAPERIIMGKSRDAFPLLFLNKENPVDKVVAWGTDMQENAVAIWNRLLKVAPDAKEIPELGTVQKGDLSVEQLLVHDPDVFVMDIVQHEAAKQSGFLDDLDKAEVPYVVIDFYRDPRGNTVPSVEILGTLFDASENAQRFADKYNSIVDPIIKAGAEAKDPKDVFYWRAPGITEPGFTSGNADFGLMIAEVGSTNLGTEKLDGVTGQITTEQLIQSQPDVIIASGSEWDNLKTNEKANTSYLKLGYDIDEKTARDSLAALKAETGYSELEAFSNGSVYGIEHQLCTSPFNFIAYLAFAHWLGTPGFEDTDVEKVWADFHDEFMPWPADGTMFVSLTADD